MIDSAAYQIARKMTSSVLEGRLEGWAQEYGGGRYEHNGWRTRNLIQTLMQFGGFVPESGGLRGIGGDRTPADEVEGIVRSMERGGYFVHSRVLRCDYFDPKMPMDMRLDELRRIGVSLSKAGYHNRLNEGKLFIAGALKIIACV